MGIDKAVKLSQDKIEADLLTQLVRRSIKRKEREKQQARKDFKEAFEVLLESQDKSTKTHDLMLEERQGCRPRFPRQEPDDISDETTSTDEESDVDYPRPRTRWPSLLYKGTVDLTRRGVVGAADLTRRTFQRLYNRWNPQAPAEPQVPAEIQAEQNRINQQEELLQRRQRTQSSQQELLNKQEEVLQQEQQLQQQRQRLRELQQELEKKPRNSKKR